MNKQSLSTTNCRGASPTVVAAAVDDSHLELRPLIERLFANEQPAAGILLAQLRLIFTRLQLGLPPRRSDYLSLLAAASRLPRAGEHDGQANC